MPAAVIPHVPRVGRRRREWVLVLVAVLCAHALLLAGGPARPGRARVAAGPAAAPVLTVRRIVAAPAASGRVVVPARAPTARSRPPTPPTRRVPGPEAAQPAGASALGEADMRAQDLPPQPAAPSHRAEPAPAATPAEGALPTYPTRVAQPFRLRYDMQRGTRSGAAELRFESGPQGYELSFDGSLPGPGAFGLSSRGALGADGLAPERFTDRRRGRDRHAANFDRAAARITYSGPQVIHPLPRGAQDRLSWMVQLPAVIDADPARWVAGTQVSIFVSGARGDADVWTFEVQGRESLTLASGQVPGALRLTRAPSRPYDTQAEVWLDPQRHHLPVRVRLATPPGGEPLDLQRSD